MEELNKAIAFARTIPQNTWDREKYLEIYENRQREALKRLEKFIQDGSEMEQKLVSRDATEADVEDWRFGRANEHIQLLERVINAKKHIEWIKRGLRQLIQDKIHLLYDKLDDTNLFSLYSRVLRDETPTS